LDAMIGKPPTEAQDSYVRALRRRHALSNATLDAHCVQRFGRPYARLDRAQASALIEEMIQWVDLPAELMRAKGQTDLPGFG
jgi:hypothetical protein